MAVDYHLRPGSDPSMMWAVVTHELPRPREVDPLAMGMEVWFEGSGEGLEAWVEVMEVSGAVDDGFQHQSFSAIGVGIFQRQQAPSHRGRFSFAAVGPYR
jgi:hypothetical protein